MRRLLTVEDTFLIESRGLVVVPAPPIDEVRGPGDIQVELKPDGGKLPVMLTWRPSSCILRPPFCGGAACSNLSAERMSLSVRKSGVTRSFSSFLGRR